MHLKIPNKSKIYYFLKMDKQFALVIHGGAGVITRGTLTPEKEELYKIGLNEALKAGYEILKKGGSALDAVENSVKSLENCPLFNAGKGAVFNAEGKNELDASIMDGSTMHAGAVAGLTTVKNPISAARAVMEKSEHVMMIGKGAEEFCKKNGLEFVDPSYFYTEERYQAYLQAKKEDMERKAMGTVGAVAIDIHGKIAAATSTGGMTYKKFGRVGDSPIIGAGTYACEECGVSCTGHGEYFIKAVVAHDISAMMIYGKMNLADAAKEVVEKKLVKMGGEGGIIALDKKCNVVMEFNSEGMYRGYIKNDGKAHVAIYKDEI